MTTFGDNFNYDDYSDFLANGWSVVSTDSVGPISDNPNFATPGVFSDFFLISAPGEGSKFTTWMKDMGGTWDGQLLGTDMTGIDYPSTLSDPAVGSSSVMIGVYNEELTASIRAVIAWEYVYDVYWPRMFVFATQSGLATAEFAWQMDVDIAVTDPASLIIAKAGPNTYAVTELYTSTTTGPLEIGWVGGEPEFTKAGFTMSTNLDNEFVAGSSGGSLTLNTLAANYTPFDLEPDVTYYTPNLTGSFKGQKTNFFSGGH